MNFFDDDFGLGSTPVYSKKNSYPSTQKGNLNADQMSRKSAKKDEFDDLLDGLLSKQEKRSAKKKQKQVVQPYSSAYLDPPNNAMDFRRTQKWSTPNIDIDQHLQSPKFPLNKHPSIMDDRGSQDGRSYKSGFTGFTGKMNNLQFDNQITLRGDPKDEAPVVERSTRNMMKPPLRKKQSRQNLGKDQTSIWDEEPQFNNFARKPPSPQHTNLDLLSNKQVKGKSQVDLNEVKNKVDDGKVKQRIIQKEKIVTIREEATELKKQFQNEIKQIKQSYERQLTLNQERLKKQVEDHKKTRNTLTKEFQQKLEEQRRKWEQLMNQSTERLKELHDWEIKKKSESYEMEIEKLKSLSKFQENILKNQNTFHMNQQNLQFKTKERELQSEKQRLQQLKFHLQQRQKNLQSQEFQFSQYKRREEQKNQLQRRSLYQKQNQIKKSELQSKRNMALQKQQLASDLAESELQIYRKRQALNLERQELKSLRQMIERQKSNFQAFNNNILTDYKMKMKEVQAQKEHLNELQIQIHKKLHFLQMTGDQLKPATTNGKSFTRPSTSNVQNHRNRSNTAISSKVNETKQRFKQMQNLATDMGRQTHDQRQKIKDKVNLSGYITRVNRALSKY